MAVERSFATETRIPQASIEKIPPHNLEISIIPRFISLVKQIQMDLDQGEGEPAEMDEPDTSVLIHRKDGVQYSDRSCPAHGTEEIYIFTETEKGEEVEVKGTSFERFPDGTIDITGVADAHLRVEDGVLLESSNSSLLPRVLQKLEILADNSEEEEAEEIEDELKSIFEDSWDLLTELTAKYDGAEIRLNVQSVGSDKNIRGKAYIREDHVVIWMGGVQNEIYLAPDGSIECVQCTYESEKPVVLQSGKISEDLIENPDYIQNCISQISDLKDFMEERARQRLRRDEPPPTPKEPVSPGQQILFENLGS